MDLLWRPHFFERPSPLLYCNIWKYFQSDKISIEPASELMQFVVDGEEVKSGKVIIEVIKKGIKLSLPALEN